MPEIAISSQDLPVSTDRKTLTFEISAKDSLYVLDRLNVFVNDVPIYGTNGINLRDKKVAALNQQINLELSAGMNKIQVSVHNEKGVESLKETIEINYTGPAAKPNLYVVAIGISDYWDDDYDLTYASKDAKDFISLLQSREEQFVQIIVLPILDKEATKEAYTKGERASDGIERG